jgi:hypothetical protein
MTPAREGQRRGGASGRPAVAVLVGLTCGLAVALATGIVFDGVPLGGPWGFIYGTLAFLVGSGATLFFGRRSSHRTWGGFVLAVGAGALGIGVWVYVSAFRVPPMTQEGAWMWPLAIISTVFALVTLRTTFRDR